MMTARPTPANHNSKRGYLKIAARCLTAPAALRRSMLWLVAACLIGSASMAPAEAKWPDKPVRIVLPFGAGGVADFTMRLLADKLSTKFDQRFVIINKPGPGGIEATLTVLNAPADGYTLGEVAVLTAISAAMFEKLPYDPATQFEMISTLGLFDMDFAVTADSPYRTLDDFIAAAKAHPGTLNIATLAVGSAQNFGAELFKSMAKLDVVIAPFQHSPDVVVALLRNDMQMAVDFPPAIQGQIDDKQIRVLATSGAHRAPSTPDIPTAAEAGVPGYEVSSWNGIFAPKGTPAEVVEAVNAAMRETLTDPELKAQFEKVGVEPRASTPGELMDLYNSDVKKWKRVVSDAKIPKR